MCNKLSCPWLLAAVWDAAAVPGLQCCTGTHANTRDQTVLPSLHIVSHKSISATVMCSSHAHITNCGCMTINTSCSAAHQNPFTTDSDDKKIFPQAVTTVQYTLPTSVMPSSLTESITTRSASWHSGGHSSQMMSDKKLKSTLQPCNNSCT